VTVLVLTDLSTRLLPVGFSARCCFSSSLGKVVGMSFDPWF
jgi:hypothetical protein